MKGSEPGWLTLTHKFDFTPPKLENVFQELQKCEMLIGNAYIHFYFIFEQFMQFSVFIFGLTNSGSCPAVIGCQLATMLGLDIIAVIIK